MRHRLHVTLLCAALMAATPGTAQTPEPAAEQPPMQQSAPVDPARDPPNDPARDHPPVETLANALMAGSEDNITPDQTPDTHGADSASMTDSVRSQQIPPDPAKRAPAPQAAATSETPTSEPADVSAYDRWLKADLTSADPTSGTASDPLTEVRNRWRGAVAGEKTDLGFRAWVIAALGADKAATAADTADDIEADDTPSTLPSTVTLIDSQASRTRDISGRWLARAGPVALGAAGRVVTTFGAAIPTAFCAPFIVCYIELEAGEVLTDTPSWGDTARWQVTVKIQGADPETVVLEIKPSEDAGLTNLVIPTDRRLYTINLVNDSEVHTPILTFIYPDTAARVASARITARKADDVAATASAKAARRAAFAARKARLAKAGVRTSAGLREPGKLDFRFSVTGKAPFRPVRVYTDGRKTYIDLHPNYRGTLPTVVPGRGEENKALNTRVEAGGKRLVADRVIRDIWLQAGSRKVRIRRSAP